LDALEGNEHGQRGPDNRHDSESDTSSEDTCGRILRWRLSTCLEDKVSSDGRIYSKPAELKQAHQKTRYEEAACRAIS